MRTILVFGEKTFKLEVPDEAKITFGPWSPGSNSKYGGEASQKGTLRVYESSSDKSNLLGVFSGVTGYRDEHLNYSEQIAREEGAILWKSDKDGYSREEKVQRQEEWTQQTAIPAKAKKKK